MDFLFTLDGHSKKKIDLIRSQTLDDLFFPRSFSSGIDGMDGVCVNIGRNVQSLWNKFSEII